MSFKDHEDNQQLQIAREEAIVAGEVHAACACCDRPRWLIAHPSLDASRRVCPRSGKTYLDRGDGLFAPDGQRLTPDALRQADEPPPDEQAAASDQLDVLSDRPSRSGPQGTAKSRIMLERSTFAGRTR